MTASRDVCFLPGKQCNHTCGSNLDAVPLLELFRFPRFTSRRRHKVGGPNRGVRKLLAWGVGLTAVVGKCTRQWDPVFHAGHTSVDEKSHAMPVVQSVNSRVVVFVAVGKQPVNTQLEFWANGQKRPDKQRGFSPEVEP